MKKVFWKILTIMIFIPVIVFFFACALIGEFVTPLLRKLVSR